MKNILKSTLATSAGVSALAAASVAAAAEFNVVVDKIQLVQDATDFTTAVTVYEPAANIGSSASTTIDLFNASQAAGTTLGLSSNVADGVYESVVVTFSSMEVSATAGTGTTIDFGGALEAAGLAYDTNNDGSSYAVVLGPDGGAGVTTVDTILTGAGSAAASAVPVINPVVVVNGSYDLPSLNIRLPESAITDSGSTLTIDEQVVLSTVAPTTAVDSASVANFAVDVDISQFSGVTGFVSGTSVVNVGLFTSALNESPIVQTELNTSTDHDNRFGDVQVSFVDIRGSVCPIAWFDANGNDKLDEGESMTFHNATVASNCTTVSGANDVSGTVALGALDATAIALGSRTITLDITAPNIADVGTTAADYYNIANVGAGEFAKSALAAAVGTATGDSLLDSAATQATGPVSGTIEVIYALNGANRTISVPVAFANDQTGTNNAALDAADVIIPVVAADASGTLSTTFNGVSYDQTTDAISIAGIPFTSITSLADGQIVGNYSVSANVRFDANDAGTAYTVTQSGATQQANHGNVILDNSSNAPASGHIIGRQGGAALAVGNL